jgi:hypothetical protein
MIELIIGNYLSKSFQQANGSISNDLHQEYEEADLGGMFTTAPSTRSSTSIRYFKMDSAMRRETPKTKII